MSTSSYLSYDLVRIRKSLLSLSLICVVVSWVMQPSSASEGAGFDAFIPSFGEQLNDDALAELPVHVFATGDGLPVGQGSLERGAILYSEQCASCHGSAGEGGRAIELVGDRQLLNSDYPDKGIAVYWPYAPTLFEYINRSMPPDKPASMTNDELYSVVGYLLLLNKLIEPGVVINAEVLSQLVMPNVNGFLTIGR